MFINENIFSFRLVGRSGSLMIVILNSNLISGVLENMYQFTSCFVVDAAIVLYASLKMYFLHQITIIWA